jgi:HEPN domain-containing protein
MYHTNIDEIIELINKADHCIFWRKNRSSKKAQLYFKKKDYKKALIYSKETENFLLTSLIYEISNKPDSATVFYRKKIEKLLNTIKNIDDKVLKLDAERQIALLYTFVGDSKAADKYLKPIPKDFDSRQKRMLLKYDFYIENYISGGYKDLLEGETVLFGIDSLPKYIDLDSLMNVHRFYFNESINSKYKIKKIFENKAIKAGFNKL